MLYQHTRLNRDVFNFVLEVISPALTKNTRKGRYQHLTPMHKLYVTLQFYATEYPGSNHDSFIWRNSAVREALAEGTFSEGWLIGDSGYPQEPWLMTPVGDITSPAEQLYNSVHISTRNPVERANGVLKSRWHVLDSPLAYTPAKVCSITTACCVLHNICTQHNLEVEDLQEYPLNDDFRYQEQQNAYHQVRRDLIERHFTR
ncbi:nuclease HARBI1 [Asbolus verrucosus]|uniref:Nuclease HARBI1 n=1 Tax=Asbolus verrucosus TaxID=1661398 RepID=A0A482V9E2_ASBVE|nr:nuclease HARBI1 [Asbolus verrucosus]